MKIVTVIPLKKGIFRETLTYFTAQEVPLGSIVTISIRNKKMLGLVVEVEYVSDSKQNIKGMDFNLKKILEIKDKSVFLKEYLESAVEVSDYFVATKNNTVASLIPAIFREKYDKISEIKIPDRPVAETKNNIKSEKLLLQASLPDRISTYKTIIRESFALKKSIFIVFPTESDLKVFESSLARGIEQFTFALHGRMTPRKALQMFEDIVTLTHPVLILGTAPFLSIPRHDIGTIILEHESSNIYKMITRPHLDLRTFVEVFAAKSNVRLILSDTLLSFDTIERKEHDGLVPMQNLSYRINFDGEIKVCAKSIPEGSTLGESRKFKILGDESIKAIGGAVEKNKNVFVFALRKGLATNTICKDCGNTLSCQVCHAPVVLYTSRDGMKRIFSCNRCKRALPAETKCRNCSSWNLMPIGIGTDTVYEEVKKLFPKTKIFKLDKDSVKDRESAEKVIKDFEQSSGSILIGTEMALFYIKNKIPVSVMASFDTLWSIPNFRMSEKIIQLLISIVSKTEKKLIIETKNTEDSAIAAFRDESLMTFIREELKERRALGYPPFKRFIKITYLGNKTETEEIKIKLKEVFKNYNPEIFSGFVAKLKDKYVTNALLRLDLENWSLPEISADVKIDLQLLHKLQSLPNSFSVVVDPEDLL